jgi:hypothetical protein
MKAALQLRRVGGLCFTLVLGWGLVPAREAGAAGECWGSWRFELAAPEPDKEVWLSADSWCRGAKLPKKLTVEVRPGEHGRAVMTGAPLRPSDVLAGAGRCEFQFAEGDGGAPKNHELSIEVSDSGAVRGTARCSERKPASGGTRGGMSISVAVTGSRSSGADPRAGAPDPRAATVVAACRQRDGDALWKMLTPRFRAELDRRAAELRRSLPASELRNLYGHKGPPRTFNGLAFLRHVVKADDSPDSPCSGAESWTVPPGVASDGPLVTVQRKDGFAFTLRFARGDGGWQLDQISKSVRPGP